MSYYKPKKFSDHYWLAEFFNVRPDMFAGDDMMILEYKNAETQQAMFKYMDDSSDFTAAPYVVAEWCQKEFSPQVMVDDTLGLVAHAVAVSKV